MPTYEYACRDCDQHVEVVQSFTDAPLTTCGLCGGQLRKVFSAAGIIFKGSGYYVTDTRGPGGRGGKGKDGDAAAASPGDSKSEGGKSEGKSEGGKSEGGKSGGSSSSSKSDGSSTSSKPEAKSA